MSETPETPTAVLLITVWFEPASPTLRARVIQAVDVHTPGETMVLVGRDAVLGVVHEWLDACAHDRPNPPSGAT
ncbi:hypothetical protein AQJ43_29830 [Streptomyces avermitilis]|uniref:Uncharacterized protein n=2 Tax=Streptomyces avermitilis TaxID=33903 RepID=Q82QU6_STRAW|nr:MULTISPECIES: hypothetical protein [Streptomyces]KUN51088.1 hypothetical protein AQJ43_29830 [Streptomyces avermitilis]MYS96097.1 hypothetical protein [Streptomyces sp. SID5469]BAC68108.1 hypothetical protein SAVERM_399 [Streptomyces avermitilis MA-4680 = NBRC 14893]BBJ47866.1 hypothetical protein SAVMC3_04950 [Streptomyces avermitilis]GDY69759.1 hypothetical protein SAV14893_091520 [Streptomyces avermitilis]